jgi:hypothetical protein
MEEGGWLVCDEPQTMLEFLHGRASDRKRRLFACASLRRVWHVLTDARSRAAIEVAERYAEGAASAGELAQAHERAIEAAEAAEGPADHAAAAAILVMRSVTPRDIVRKAPTLAAWATRYAAEYAAGPVRFRSPASVKARARAPRYAERAVQCGLLHDLFGNPFRPPPPIDPRWLTWEAGTVKRLAQAAYDERDLPAGTLDQDRLAVLADALEEAGCQDGQILGHLRYGGDHVRGCWALDLVLGKS